MLPQWPEANPCRRLVPGDRASDGKEKIVELKFISMCPARYSRQAATSLVRASAAAHEQLEARARIISGIPASDPGRLRLKDTELLHTPDDQVGPLAPAWIYKRHQPTEGFEGGVVAGLHNEQPPPDKLAKLGVTV